MGSITTYKTLLFFTAHISPQHAVESFDRTLVVHHHQTLILRRVHIACNRSIILLPCHHRRFKPMRQHAWNPNESFCRKRVDSTFVPANHEDVCAAKINGCLGRFGRFAENYLTNRRVHGRNKTKTHINFQSGRTRDFYKDPCLKKPPINDFLQQNLFNTVDGSEIHLTTWNPVNNGIFAISTGEFTGVLNHQQYNIPKIT